MRLTSTDALACIQAINRNPSDDFALVSCSDTLDSPAKISASLARTPPCEKEQEGRPRHDQNGH
jgi:hypothetical protein